MVPTGQKWTQLLTRFIFYLFFRLRESTAAWIWVASQQNLRNEAATGWNQAKTTRQNIIVIKIIFMSNYSTNYRRHLMFMATPQNYSITISVNESTDAKVSTKQHCMSQTPSHTILHQSRTKDATMAKDQSREWVTQSDPWPKWPIELLTHDPCDPWPWPMGHRNRARHPILAQALHRFIDYPALYLDIVYVHTSLSCYIIAHVSKLHTQTPLNL